MFSALAKTRLAKILNSVEATTFFVDECHFPDGSESSKLLQVQKIEAANFSKRGFEKEFAESRFSESSSFEAWHPAPRCSTYKNHGLQ